jgi:hypothetical protein
VRAQEELSRHSLLAAAQTALGIQLRYARAGIGLAGAAMAGARECEPLRHYPARDVSDAAARTRFYYHAHTSQRCPRNEHGHFHLFGYGLAHGGPGASGPDFFHLAGLSLDAKGQALRWFTTNRWVTGERWVAAQRIVKMLPQFEVHTHGRLAPVASWLGAMVRLFAPQIAAMVRERDAVLALHGARLGREAAFEDRTLDVVTECPAGLAAHVRQLGL